MDKANSEVLYIGEYPPPFGGVTVKNKLLKDARKKNKSKASSKGDTILKAMAAEKGVQI